MIAILVAHAVASLVAIPLVHRFGRNAFLAMAVVPAASAVWVLANFYTVVEESILWAPSVHMNIELRMDALSALLALIALGVGALVLFYCRWYFDADEPRLHLFAAELVAFAGVMFGLVVADNMIVMFIFWELTSILSFLLVGHHAERATSRRAATQALLVTTLGGLAMFVGIIIIGESAGSYLLSEVVHAELTGPLIHAAIVLVLLGALSKSAIAPLHFWLPGAMAAPTPVSAYLHSAAMVKAGVFLIARLAPGFSGSMSWQLPVIALGTVSLLMAGWRALREHDLKLILAFGTVSQLGFLTILVGIGSSNTMIAGLGMLVAHTLFKSTLFMTVGLIDHQTGTRDIRQLSGLGRRMPAVATVAGLAAASMAGLPPFLGFMGKEAALETVLDAEKLHGLPGIGLVFFLVVGSVFTFAYSLRLVLGAFRSKAAFDYGESPAVARSRPPRAAFLAVPALLAGLGLVLGVYGAPVQRVAETYAANAFPAGTVWADEETYHFALWHGISAPLALTLLIYLLGTLLYVAKRSIERLQFESPALGNADRIYDAVLAYADYISLRLTGITQRGSLPLTLGIILLTLVVFPLSMLIIGFREGLEMDFAENPAVLALFIPMLCVSLAAAVLRNRLATVLCVGVTGYGVAVIFAVQGAPDLALTQALVETLMIVIIVLVLRTMPAEVPLTTTFVRTRAWIAVGVGVLVTAGGAYAINARTHVPVAEYFPDLAYHIGHGSNAVNVTLVDIRAWDTLGEISVLLVAATGVASLVFRRRRYGSGPSLADVEKTRLGREGSRLARQARESSTFSPVNWLAGVAVRDPRTRSLVLEVTTRIIFPSMMVLSIYLFFAGHNNPGGGFAGGLVAGLALVLRFLAGGRYELGEAIPIDVGRILGAGLLFAIGPAIVALALGEPALRSWVFEFTLPIFGQVHFVTAIIFDVGVYLIVVGLVLDILRSLGARLDHDATAVSQPISYTDATRLPVTAPLHDVAEEASVAGDTTRSPDAGDTPEEVRP